MADVGIKFDAEGYSEFKKNLKDCQDQMRVMGSSLKEVKSQFDKNDTSVEALTKKNAALEKSIKTQKEQVDLLAKGVDAATDEWTENDKRTQDLIIKYNNAKTTLNKLTREYDDNAKAIDGVGDEAKETGNQLENASDGGLKFGDVLKANVIGDAIVAGVRALGSAIRDVASGLKDAVVDAAAFADTILTDSTVTGLSTDALQEYKYMAELTDVSVDTITGSLTKLTKNMETAKKGTGSAADAFNALGVSFTDSNGELRNNQDVFADVIDALGKMDNETQRDAYSMSIFGKSAQDLNPLLAQGKDGIAALAKEAHDMGYVLDEDALSALGAVDDAMQRFNNTKTAVKNQIAQQLAPTITDISQKFQDWAASVDWQSVGEKIKGVISSVKEMFNFIKDNWETIVTAIAAIAAGFLAWNVAGMISGVVSAIKAFQVANEGATVAQALLNGVLAANPIMLVAAAVAALVAGIIVLWNTNEDFRNAVIEIWESIKKAFVDAWNSIKQAWSGCKAFFAGVWNGIKNVFSDAWESFKKIGKRVVDGIKTGISNAWNSLKSWFNNLWDSLFGNRNVNVSVGKAAESGVNGSHASGLSYVPFDGYIAELHRGEMVVPSNIAETLRSNTMRSVSSTPVTTSAPANHSTQVQSSPINITVQSILDGKIIGESVTRYQNTAAKRGGLALVGG